MKLYIISVGAGDRARHDEVAARAGALGYEIISSPDVLLGDEDMRAKLDAIDQADVVWLVSAKPSWGHDEDAWVEWGYAVGLRHDRTLLRPLRALVSSGATAAGHMRHADACFVNNEDALKYLADLKRERVNYVLCAWSGKRRANDKRLLRDPALFLREHIDSLLYTEHHLAQITIAVPHNKHEPRAFRRFLSSIPKEIQGAPVVVFERKNVGMSYGSLADVHARYGSDFEFYFLMEDDYVFTRDNFDSLHLGMMREHPRCGYVCGLVWDQRGNLPRHAGVSNGLFRERALADVVRRRGALPHADDTRYGNNELLGQVGQSQAIIEAGWDILDWRGRYKVLFRDANDVIQTFHEDAAETIMAPI